MISLLRANRAGRASRVTSAGFAGHGYTGLRDTSFDGTPLNWAGQGRQRQMIELLTPVTG
jgi:hypothetical protein